MEFQRRNFSITTGGVSKVIPDGQTFQSLIYISFPKIVGEKGVGGGGVNKFPDIAFITNFRNNLS